MDKTYKIAIIINNEKDPWKYCDGLQRHAADFIAIRRTRRLLSGLEIKSVSVWKDRYQQNGRKITESELISIVSTAERVLVF